MNQIVFHTVGILVMSLCTLVLMWLSSNDKFVEYLKAYRDFAAVAAVLFGIAVMIRSLLRMLMSF